MNNRGSRQRVPSARGAGAGCRRVEWAAGVWQAPSLTVFSVKCPARGKRTGLLRWHASVAAAKAGATRPRSVLYSRRAPLSIVVGR